MLNRLIIFATALAFLFLGAGSTLAQSADGISIQPAYPREGNERTKHIFVREVIAESFIQEGVVVINDTAAPQRVRVYAADYQPSNGGGFACEQYVEEDDEAGAWLRVSVEEVLVPPGSIEIVPFSIRIPENVSAGEHNACILAELILENPKRNAEGLSVSTRSAIRVALLVAGDLTKGIQVKDFTFEQEDGMQFFVPTLRNVGSVSADVDVTITVRTLFGQRISEFGGTFAVLRDISKELRLEMLERPLFGGWYTAEVGAQYDPNPNTVVGIRDEENFVTVSAPIMYFFLMPQPMGVAIMFFVLLALIGFIVERHFAFYRKHKIADTWVTYTATQGENIQRIAQAHDISWRVLVRANKLKKPYTLAADREILVPPNPSSGEGVSQKS